MAVAGSERQPIICRRSQRKRRDQDVLDHALCADHRVPAGAGIAQRRLDLPGRGPRLLILIIAALGWPIVALAQAVQIQVGASAAVRCSSTARRA